MAESRGKAYPKRESLYQKTVGTVVASLVVALVVSYAVDRGTAIDQRAILAATVRIVDRLDDSVSELRNDLHNLRNKNFNSEDAKEMSRRVNARMERMERDFSELRTLTRRPL